MEWFRITVGQSDLSAAVQFRPWRWRRCSSKTSLTTYTSTSHHIPGDLNCHTKQCLTEELMNKLPTPVIGARTVNILNDTSLQQSSTSDQAVFNFTWCLCKKNMSFSCLLASCCFSCICLSSNSQMDASLARSNWIKNTFNDEVINITKKWMFKTEVKFSENCN